MGLISLPVLPLSPARKPVLVTQTWLKALPGRHEQLVRFLELNWLAMDRLGIEDGIFSHATLYEVAPQDATAASDADVMVEVGYFTPAGYRDVERRFMAIRQQHRPVPVDGMALAELGRIVGERQLRIRASG
ncbi:hypothetical protein ACPVPU_01310 [Sphingomonas sp. CJ99]